MVSATNATAFDYPPETAEYVRDQLASGRFRSEADLIAAALTVMREVDARHRELRERIQRSLDQAARGEIAPLDIAEIKAELAQEWDAISRRG
jgi:putative addiction module CopG family antidote